MAKEYSEVLDMIRTEIKKRGSAKAFAFHCDVSQTFLGRVIHGQSKPGPKILNALGLEAQRIDVYAKKKRETK
jgi:hypothetical protein